MTNIIVIIASTIPIYYHAKSYPTTPIPINKNTKFSKLYDNI